MFSKRCVFCIIQFSAWHNILVCGGFRWEKIGYSILQNRNKYQSQIEQCVSRGEEPIDLRGAYTHSMLNQLHLYYEDSITAVQMKTMLYIGLRRPSSFTPYPEGTTDFNWYNGDPESGDIFKEFSYITKEQDTTQYCGVLKHNAVNTASWNIVIQACYQKRGVMCQHNTGLSCSFDVYYGLHLQSPDMVVFPLTDVMTFNICRHLCDNSTIRCWSFSYNSLSKVCDLFLCEDMPTDQEFCKWLVLGPCWDTARRNCMDVSVISESGSLRTLPKCRYQPYPTGLSPNASTTITNVSNTGSNDTFCSIDTIQQTVESTRISSWVKGITTSTTLSSIQADTSLAQKTTDTTLFVNVTETTTMDDNDETQFNVSRVDATAPNEEPDTLSVDRTATTTSAYNEHNTVPDATGTLTDRTILDIVFQGHGPERNPVSTTTKTSTPATSLVSSGVTQTSSEAMKDSVTAESISKNGTRAVSSLKMKYKRSCCTCRTKHRHTHVDIFSKLHLDKRKLSSYKRMYTSYPDSRPSAILLGLCATAVLILSSLSVSFMDREILFRGIIFLTSVLCSLPGRRISRNKRRSR